jgi:hypothetical protein
MIMRTLGSTEDDLRVLIAKGFAIPFERGVIVITHWKENNYLQADRYKTTIYQKEFKSLECIENVYILDTQVRLELGKDKVLTAKQVGGKDNPNNIELLTDYFIKVSGSKQRRERYFRTAGEILVLSDNNLEKAKARVDLVNQWADKENMHWELDTVIKKYMQLENKML